jgi:hypothetical protein
MTLTGAARLKSKRTIMEPRTSTGGIDVEQKNLDIYGNEPIPWSRALKALERAPAKPEDPGGPTTYWLATTRPDGRPHVAGVGAIWLDGRFYFVSGAGTRKSRNLAVNPNCVISVKLAGMDLVVEGTTRVVTDEPALQRLAKLYAAQGWPASVSGGAFTAPYSAPSAGPPPWNLYVMTPSTAFGVASVEPYGATRWRF